MLNRKLKTWHFKFSVFRQIVRYHQNVRHEPSLASDSLSTELGIHTLLVITPSCYLCYLISFSSIYSFFVGAKAQLHANSIVKALPVFLFQTLSLFLFWSVTSLPADLKTDCSELKTREPLWILQYFHPPNINLFCTLKDTLQHSYSSYIHSARHSLAISIVFILRPFQFPPGQWPEGCLNLHHSLKAREEC